MTFSRDPLYQEQSIAIPLKHLIATTDTMGQYLDREVATWLVSRGVTDVIDDCQWWVDRVNAPNCIRVWIRDERLRLLFKLTWGGS